MEKTKILCTIGPASFMEEVLRAMLEAGMDGARINTAYGDIHQYKNVIANVRRIGDIPILFDLKGPELRMHTTKQLSVKEGDYLKIGEGMDISFNHPVYDQLRVGDKILFDDAKIETEVLGSEDDARARPPSK